MGIFTRFRRGKTIENQELEPYNPAGTGQPLGTWGNMPPAPPGDIECNAVVHYSPSEFHHHPHSVRSVVYPVPVAKVMRSTRQSCLWLGITKP